MATTYDWYYNRVTGAVSQLIWGEAQLFHATGIWLGPFADKQAAIDFYNAGKPQHPDWAPPTDPLNLPQLGKNAVDSANTAATNQANQAASDAANKAINAVTGGGGTNNNWENWIIRIGEILLGLVLIAVGVNGLTKTVNTIKTAGKAAAVAAAV